MIDKPVVITTDIQQAVCLIKEAIQRSQARSLHHINNELLSLYYAIGKFISENSRKNKWGTAALRTIGDQLQKEIPGLTGFGETSLKNMRTFYEEWSEYVNRHPLADDLPIDENQLLLQIRQPMGDDLDWQHFLSVPFSYHVITMGVATFRLGENAPEEYNRILPDLRQLNQLMQEK